MRPGNLRRWRFIKPDWRITLALLFFCALTLTAGQWQDRRAAYKADLQARFDERSQAAPTALTGALVDAKEYDQRPVRVEGMYEPKYGILVDNKVYKGRAGYQVYTPLKIGGSETYVLVNRGWAQQGKTRADLPQVPTPTGLQQVSGVAVIPPTRFMELKADVDTGEVWQNLLLEHYRVWSGLALQPIIVEQIGEAADGLIREAVRPDLGIEKHRIYALQWYSFCTLAIALYAFFHIKRIPRAD